MNAVIIYCFLALCVSRVFSVTISTPSPAFQRRNLGESYTVRWNLTGNFTTYSIKLFSTGSSTVLGANTNITLNSRDGVITLFIWNIQISNAGNYSLSIPTGPSTEINSVAVLFVYTFASAYTTLAVGRNPGYEGDKIELNCSVTPRSFPPEFRTKMYYFWSNTYYGNFRNTTSGPAVLQNGDLFPGYSIKNDGITLVIDSARNPDSSFICSVKEEGSSSISSNIGLSGVQIYGKPYTYSITPVSRRFNVALNAYANTNFYYRANPPLTSCSNWSFVSTSGSTTEYSVGSSCLTSTYLSSSLYLSSYGNFSITLANSNGSRTETFQVLPQGPPDTPSNVSVQYVTHSLISLQWRCMWFNGVQQTVIVRLMDASNDVEVETKALPLGIDCYNLAYNTLFQNNIQPETNYEASIWSINTRGSSNVLQLTATTTKRLVFDTSPCNISIMGNQATINFSITDSTKAILWLNVSCCVEFTTQCRNKSYLIANTDKQVTYDNLQTGTEYVFDFTVCDSDGYTYWSTLAILKGVRVSRKGFVDSTKCRSSDLQDVEKENPLIVAVIVLAVLLGVAVLALLGCCIVFLVCRSRQKNLHQQSTTVLTSTPARSKIARPQSEYPNGEDYYEPVVDVSPSKENAYYKALETPAGTDKQSSGAWQKGQSSNSRQNASNDEDDNYENMADNIFHMKPDRRTLDISK